MVAGQKINDEKLNAMASEAALIVCHNASFDRKFLEQRFPIFEKKAFACSMLQIDWVAEGLGSTKLEYILYKLGFHYEGHRAINDCYALLEALQCKLPESGSRALLAMIIKARQKDVDVGALRSPFETKDILKARKYSWTESSIAKYWHKAIAATNLDAEVAWLREHVYNNRRFSLQVTEVDAMTRFSERKTQTTVISY